MRTSGEEGVLVGLEGGGERGRGGGEAFEQSEQALEQVYLGIGKRPVECCVVHPFEDD